MKIQVKDAQAVDRNIVVQGVETPVDRSGVIAATGVSQIAIEANEDRAGWYIQNMAESALFVREIDGDASADADGGSFLVQPGECFPPPGYPVTLGAIAVAGTEGAAFTAREW